MRDKIGWIPAIVLLLGSPVGAQPPVPPPVDAPVQSLPPINFGTAPCPPLPQDGYDPGLDGWSIFGPGSAPTALLFGIDVSILAPKVKNDIALNPNTPSFASYNGMISSPLDWTVSPRFEVGYRLTDGQGQFLAAYRFMASEGDETLGATGVRSRLNVNVVDLLYRTERLRLFGNFNLHWSVGGRIASSFYDTRNIDGALTQSESSNFFGGGILGAFDLEYAFDSIRGLSVYTNVEGSVVLGDVEQNFHTSIGGFTDSATQRGTQAAQTLAVQLGVSYVPPAMENLRFRVAYQFEEWWNLGKLQNSNLQLQSQGVLMRLELVY